MKSPLRRFLCLAWCVVAVWPVVVGATPDPSPSPASLPPEAVADFEWFSTLGFPDLRGCPVALVTTGQWMPVMMFPRFENTPVDAFLLRPDDGTGRFTVLTTDLFTHEFAKAAEIPKEMMTSEPPEDWRVDYETKPLADAADAYLARLPRPRDEMAIESSRFVGKKTLSERGEIFLWAWACWRNGLDERAARLYEYASSLLRPPDSDFYPKDSDIFRERLEQDLAYSMIWRTTVDFADVKISRPQLLAAFERVARDYSRSESAPSARATADRLRKMIAEDTAHAARRGVPIGQFPVDQRIPELIFRLRDQTGRQNSQPGSCNIFAPYAIPADSPEPDEDPATSLVDLGYAAVPRLMAALGDRSFSRAVGFHRDFYFSHHVLTVGDCAEQTLESIAGRSFCTPETADHYLSRDYDPAEVRKQVEAWWQEVQRKSERQTTAP